MKPTKGQLIFIMIIFVIILSTCESKMRKINLQTIRQAEQILETTPLEAVHLLDSVQTGLLNQRDYARYQVIRTRAKDMAGFNVTSDTAIFLARDYLVNHDDKYAALACYTAANIYNYQNKPSLSIRNYLKAALYVSKTDYQLNGAIYNNLGRIHYTQRLYLESLDFLKKSILFDELAGVRKEYKVYSYELIGLNYLFLHKPDSALYYINKTVNTAISDTFSQNYLHHYAHYISLALRDAGQYSEAKSKCLLALSRSSEKDTLNIGRLTLTLASIYGKTNQHDSAYIIAHQAKPMLDKFGNNKDLADMYELLMQLESQRGNDAKAIEYQHANDKYTYAMKSGIKLIQAEQKSLHDAAMIIQEERNRSLIKSLMYRNIIIILVSLQCAFFGVLFFMWYHKKKKNTLIEVHTKYVQKIEQVKEQHQHQLKHYEKTLNGERQQVEELKLQYEVELNNIKVMLDDERMNRLYRIDDLAELKQYMKARNDKQVKNQIMKILNYNTWDDIYPIMDSLYPGLFDQIKADYPEFIMSEFRTCCLLFMGFGTITIATILDDTNVGSIYNRSTAIREKMGLEQRMDIRKFIMDKYRDIINT